MTMAFSLSVIRAIPAWVSVGGVRPMTELRVRRGLAACALVIALVVSGCSGDTDTRAARSTPAAADAPAAGAPVSASASVSTPTGPGATPGDPTPPTADPAATDGSETDFGAPPAGPTPPPTGVTATGPQEPGPAGPSDPGTAEPIDPPAIDLPATTADLPEGWPAEVGLPPGAEVYVDPEAGSAGRSLAFRGPGSPTDLGAFFTTELTAAGYAAADRSTADGAFTATFTRDGTTVEVVLVAADTASVGTVAITP